MTLITETSELAELCERLALEPFICVDTEFMRESTYWPLLCLVQIAGPDGVGYAIDPLAAGISLDPMVELLNLPNVLKVLHAARQDLEIFYNLSGGRVPTPLFDTQVAAMVCGFGEAASYDRLARKLARAEVDKASRFTDWSKRPLTDRQLTYALADVEHLPTIYKKLDKRLNDTRRGDWVAQELDLLTATDAYELDPRRAWTRIKTRTSRPQFLAVLREVAAARELFAQRTNVPRNRVIRDEALLEIAAHETETLEDLLRTRGVSKGLASGPLGAALLEGVKIGKEVPKDDAPRSTKAPDSPRGAGPLVDLLKVLLKMRCEENDVAVKLVANTADLERIAADDNADVRAMAGWRRSLFGDDALALKHGTLALSAEDGRIALVELEDPN
jgi:ribonuclease D